MAEEIEDDRPSDERVEIVCRILREQFGDRCRAIVATQVDAASGAALATWLAVITRLDDGPPATAPGVDERRVAPIGLSMTGPIS